MQVKHTLKPYYNKDSEILILGTMPSPKSRELGFYYMHPQNRFWPCLAQVFKEEIPSDIESKKEFLKRHKIALWDTCAVCEILKKFIQQVKNLMNYIIDIFIPKLK